VNPHLNQVSPDAANGGVYFAHNFNTRVHVSSSSCTFPILQVRDKRKVDKDLESHTSTVVHRSDLKLLHASHLVQQPVHGAEDSGVL
jgi:hypothetical protein